MLGDDIAAALPQLREHAESMMRDQCVVTRVTGATADPDDREVPVRTPIYTGRCRVQANQRVDASPEVGGATVTVQRYEIQVPISAGPIRIGDLIAVADRKFRVTGLHLKTHQTAQRLPVEEVT